MYFTQCWIRDRRHRQQQVHLWIIGFHCSENNPVYSIRTRLYIINFKFRAEYSIVWTSGYFFAIWFPFQITNWYDLCGYPLSVDMCGRGFLCPKVPGHKDGGGGFPHAWSTTTERKFPVKNKFSNNYIRLFLLKWMNV